MKRPRALLLALTVLSASAALAAPAGATSITELPPLIPGSVPQGITAGPDGNVWFVENRASRFGRVVPSTGKINDLSTGSGICAGSLPAEITPGPDGGLWFTEEAAQPDRADRPRQGDRAGVPGLRAARTGITAGPDGNLWFTEYGTATGSAGSRRPASITEFPPASPTAAARRGIAAGPGRQPLVHRADGRQRDRADHADRRDHRVHAPASRRQRSPYGIAAGPDGNLWFTEQTGNADRPDHPGRRRHRVRRRPRAGSGPVGITAGPDGNLWFTESAASATDRPDHPGRRRHRVPRAASAPAPLGHHGGPGRQPLVHRAVR